jgi:hypothetical protein
MNTGLITGIISVCLIGAVLLGSRIRRRLPEHHLGGDTKDTVKLAMGLVATMSALVLGLLVSSAKTSYDNTRGQVIQMAAKISFLDRLLEDYGPEANDVRSQIRALVEEGVRQMWPSTAERAANLNPNIRGGDALYAAIQRLSPKDDVQHSLKSQASALVLDLGQSRTMLRAQSVPSISKPLLIVVVGWLMVIFLSFSLLAPPNATAILALMVAALSVGGAILLILELDHPFGGLIQISSEPLLNVLNHLAK